MEDHQLIDEGLPPLAESSNEWDWRTGGLEDWSLETNWSLPHTFLMLHLHLYIRAGVLEASKIIPCAAARFFIFLSSYITC